MLLAQTIDQSVSEWLKNAKLLSKEESSIDYIGSETVGEIIEKLLILNIRIWILEDTAAAYKKEEQTELYALTKAKLDICFKVKRPQLVSALNKVFEIISPNNSFTSSDNIKHYKNEE